MREKVSLLTVRMQDELFRRLKHSAIDHNTTQTAMVAQAITEYLDRLDKIKTSPH